MQPPVMPEDGHTTRVSSGTDATATGGKESSVPEPIWDDDDTKAFYESLPDLRFDFQFLPLLSFLINLLRCYFCMLFKCICSVLNFSLLSLSINLSRGHFAIFFKGICSSSIA